MALCLARAFSGDVSAKGYYLDYIGGFPLASG